MKNRNLSFKITFYLLISEVLLATVIIIMGYRFTRNSIYDNLLYRVKYQVSNTVEPLTASMEETTFLINMLKTEIEKTKSIQETEHMLEMALKLNPNILSFNYLTVDESNPDSMKAILSLFRENDEIKRVKNPPKKANIWFNNDCLQVNYGWTTPFLDSISNQFAVRYSSRFGQKNGAPRQSVLRGTISLNKTFDELRSMKITNSGFPIVIFKNGTVVFHPNQKFIGKKSDNLFECLGDDNFDLKKIVENQSTGKAIIYPNCSGKKKSIAIYWPLESVGCTMLIVIKESEILASLNRTIILIILIVLFILSLTAAASIYLSIRLVSPINVLVDDSRRILEEEGLNWPRRQNEIEVLAEGIELMKHRLDSYKRDSVQKSIDKAEIDRELNLAKDIEMGMVPTQFPLYPERTDFECYGKLIPAKTVGGDLFDIFMLDDNYLFISICDTLGKGIPAAMFSVVTRTLIRSLANPITRLGKIMEQLNEELSLDGKSEMFVTVFLAKLDLRSGELTYCNAGHPRPYIARSNNIVEELEISHGIPVGVRKKIHFKENTIMLKYGDSLIAYTDGISEEVDDIGEFYGTLRLVSIIRMYAAASCEKLVEEILKSVAEFRSNSDSSDDTTIVAVKYLGTITVE